LASLKKLDHPIHYFRQFQSKANEGAKFKDLKIRGVLKQENGVKDIK
jgi:hypothetical protein